MCEAETFCIIAKSAHILNLYRGQKGEEEQAQKKNMNNCRDVSGVATLAELRKCDLLFNQLRQENSYL